VNKAGSNAFYKWIRRIRGVAMISRKRPNGTISLEAIGTSMLITVMLIIVSHRCKLEVLKLKRHLEHHASFTARGLYMSSGSRCERCSAVVNVLYIGVFGNLE